MAFGSVPSASQSPKLLVRSAFNRVPTAFSNPLTGIINFGHTNTFLGQKQINKLHVSFCWLRHRNLSQPPRVRRETSAPTHRQRSLIYCCESATLQTTRRKLSRDIYIFGMSEGTNGKYIESHLQLENGDKIMIYTWAPPEGIQNARGTLFLQHGVNVHARFEFLDEDDNNCRTRYEGSLISQLNSLGLVVVGHDHPGHGQSVESHHHINYFERFDDLVDVSLSVVDNILNKKEWGLKEKKTFALGMSMGGAVAIMMGRKNPDIFSGVILCSPAVRPPDSMFGLWGMFLAKMSRVLSWATPKLRVLPLPPSPFDNIREAYEKDDLICLKPMRCRVGAEFLVSYQNIRDNWDKVTFPVVVYCGDKDELVSPAGIKEFIANIKSTDKGSQVFEKMGHEVLREPGRETVREALVQWTKERL